MPLSVIQQLAAGASETEAESQGVVLGTPVTGTSSTSDKTFDPGEDNSQFFDDSVTDINAIIENVGKSIYQELLLAGNTYGFSPVSMQQLFAGWWNKDGALGLIDRMMQDAEANRRAMGQTVGPGGHGLGESGQNPITKKHLMGANYFMQTLQGFNELTKAVWDFYKQKAGIDLGDFGVNRGGGGRSGPSGPSAEDIRNSFDLDQLAEGAKNIWRGLLLDDDIDARGMARSYVDAMVAGKGKKKIDFTEFIRNKAKATPRYASIYRNKPGSVSEEQFLAPYFQSALQVVSPDQADEIAIGGAQFGATGEQFAQRLRRSEAASSSAPFIEELQGRLMDLNKLFKGGHG